MYPIQTKLKLLTPIDIAPVYLVILLSESETDGNRQKLVPLTTSAATTMTTTCKKYFGSVWYSSINEAMCPLYF